MHFADLFIIKRKHKPLSSQLSQHPNFLFFPQISICPLSSCSSSRTRERERERERTLSRRKKKKKKKKQSSGEKILFRRFRTDDALALFPRKKNRLNGHLALSSFPRPLSPQKPTDHVRGSSDRGRSSFMRESRGGDVRVRVSSGDV